MAPYSMKALLTAAAACGLLALSTAAQALPDSNTIGFSNCTLTMPGSYATATARCGFLEVPEDPAEPAGRMLRIHVAVAEATGQDVAPDPVFFFAGGPGQAATETWVTIRTMLHKIRKHRDIVMIDQRGTGQSHPLRCKTDNEADLNAEIDFERLARETRECLQDLDADPRLYTTTVAMQDYDLVRRAMGYGQINLVGISYGTRAAQVYLRQFPGTVRTVTLDSVVPMQLALGQEHAPMLDRAVDAVLADCARDSECNSLYPDQGGELNRLIQQLREQPRQITITHPTTGKPLELRLSAETLAVALRFLSYSSETQALLPLLIHEALTTGDLHRLTSQAMLVMSGLNEMIAHGMELSVMCSEDYPFIDPQADYSDTLLGNTMLQAIRTQCAVWPRAEVPADFHQPVRSDVPVLLMAGERDPVTPPAYAAEAAETFPNSLTLVARGQSHSVLRLACLQDVTTRFVELGGLQGLDTSCVADILPSPFFTSLLGPDP